MGGFRDREGRARERWVPGADLLSGKGEREVVKVFLGLGSNLGDRLGFLRGGLRALVRGGLTIEVVSSVVETPAVGYEDQPAFLNLVTVGGWSREPGDLLGLIACVEAEAGRTRSFRNAPRTLDVDVIFYGCLILRRPGLRVPHPRWKDRSFVARPLQQVAPELVDPETGLTVDEVCRYWPQGPETLREVLPMGEFSWEGP
jgi:2-amino-4-hydroxy-6-hydroxymethyldihydropteridine diphosphokinase